MWAVPEVPTAQFFAARPQLLAKNSTGCPRLSLYRRREADLRKQSGEASSITEGSRGVNPPSKRVTLGLDDPNNSGHECIGSADRSDQTRHVGGRATALVIAFDSLWLRAVCEGADKADSELGAVVARMLRNRLADLSAASSPMDLVAGGPRVIKDGDLEYMVISLQNGFRIELVPNHVNNPRDRADRIDWARVSRIKIIGIRHVN